MQKSAAKMVQVQRILAEKFATELFLLLTCGPLSWGTDLLWLRSTEHSCYHFAAILLIETSGPLRFARLMYSVSGIAVRMRESANVYSHRHRIASIASVSQHL